MAVEEEKGGVSVRIWVDADACPTAVKEVLFRTAKRLEIMTTLVANQSIWVPVSKFLDSMAVSEGADMADHKIVSMVKTGDLVITEDIPLAARVVEKGGIAIGTRGQIYDETSVHGRLASRNLMEQLRSAGEQTRGPKPLDNKDIQAFANQLDRTLTRLIRDAR